MNRRNGLVVDGENGVERKERNRQLEAAGVIRSLLQGEIAPLGGAQKRGGAKSENGS